MQGTSSTSRITFGLYEVDLAAGELWRAGFRVKLQSQPFKVLAMLVERPGEVVTREELQRHLWGDNTNVDFDHSLATAINKIREALRDSADNPRFVETLARRGYRFIAPVTAVRDAETAAAVPDATSAAVAASVPVARSEAAPWPTQDLIRSAEPIEASPEAVPAAEIVIPERPLLRPTTMAAEPVSGAAPVRGFSALAVAATALLVGAAALAVGYFGGLRRAPLRPPHMVQLTHTGHLAVDMGDTEDVMASVNDGFELFVPVLEGGREELARVPTAPGGTPTPLSIPDEVAGPTLGDISPDGTRLLLRNHLSPESEQPLWVVPISGGSALRVNDVLAHDATWMPDGRGILFAAGYDLYLTHIGGGTPEHFASLPGRAFWMRWNPSGQLLRFTIIDPIGHTESLWELSAEDHRPRQILKNFTTLPTECCGVWTPDSKYYVFQAFQGGNTDLWALPGTSTSGPFRLTDGPLQFESPVASREGNTLFFLGVDTRSQMERLTPAGTLVLQHGFLSSAVRVDFSRDRKWVAWTDDAGHLWRSAADGSEKLQLTPDSLDVFLARWSPDGARLAFMAREPGQAWKLYMVSSSGGDLQPLLRESRNAADPSWSPDGRSLVFGRINDRLGKENAARTLELLNLQTGSVEQVPDSEGLFSPRWSPDGKYIAALSLDQREVRLFEVSTRRWRTLPVHSGADPVWSPDGKFLYLHEALNPAQPIDRISIPEGNVQQLIRLAESSEADAVSYVFAGLSQDDEPLIVERTFTGNMYTMQLP